MAIEYVWQFKTSTYQVTFPYTPNDFIHKCLNVEKKLGRYRGEGGYSDRIMDIDILAIENVVMDSEELIVPHPRLHLRKFALIPFQELWPNWIHPVFNYGIDVILERCDDEVVPNRII